MSCKEPKKLLLERYITAECSSQERKEADTHLAACEVCNNYLQTLRSQKETFLLKHPFPAFAAKNLAKDISPSPAKAWHWRSNPKLAFVSGLAILILVCIPVFWTKKPTQAQSDIIWKGGPSISYLHRHNGMVNPGNPTKPVRAGDEIQVKYNAAGFPYISLFSLDSKGVFSFYQPNAHSEIISVNASKASDAHYPTGIQLDNSKGYELIVAYFSKSEVSQNQIKSIVKRHLKTNDLESLASELDGLNKKDAPTAWKSILLIKAR